MMPFDLSILTFFESIRTPFLNSLMMILTFLGQEVVPIFVLCLIFWCIDKKTGYILGFSYFTAGLLLQIVKIIFRVERPWIRWTELTPVKAAVSGATGYSFPSGHTQGATALYGTLFLTSKQKAVRTAAPLLILAVAVSRVYLGVHTPTDVVTAILLTVVFTFLAYKMIPGLYSQRKSDAGLCIFVLVYSLIALSFAILSVVRLGLVYKLGADCFKAAGAGIGFAVGYFVERKYIDFDTRCKSKAMQVLKLVIGITVALLIKEVPKRLFPGNPVSDTMRYFAAAIWTIIVYPIFIKKYFAKKEDSNILENRD